VLPVAPEEVAARIAQQLAAAGVQASTAGSRSSITRGTTSSRQMQTILERISAPFLLIGILSLLWMILRARGIVPGVFSEKAEVMSVIALWSVLFFVVSAVGFLSTRSQGND
jgi:uncharacterized membrane protein